jgi:murein DD-endopeptidase MepM/ murein hydrolase activator NlpD
MRRQRSERESGRSGALGARGVVATLATVAALVLAGSAQATYTVKPGDTLSGIAQRHGTSVSALMQENGITAPDRLRAGIDLSIPGGGGSGSGGTAYHVVRPGENLSAIARRYGVSSSQLVEWNGLGDAATVWAGSRLSVRGPAAVNVASSGAGSHRIAPGETLSAIARRYGVSASTLAASNGISDPNRIQAGATLTFPGGGGWHCPVTGPVRFINDFGIAKPSGRFHNGVDLYAPRGTPVVAPVAGRVEQVRGARAGLQFLLHGDDGHTYIGTHLDAFGASGRVAGGEVLGTVGTSGNARGTSPHLHFEVHLRGSEVTNPHPSLRTACG